MSRTAIFSAVIITLLAVPFSQVLSGNVAGKVNFKGAKPAIPKIKMNADAKCIKLHTGKEVTSEQVVVNPNNTLRYVFVYVKRGLEGKKFPVSTEKATIDQRGCMYSPHVFGIMVNQPIEIVNDDPLLHNIHALPKNSAQFNIAQPKQGMKMVRTFTTPEIMVKVKCEVHNWMACYVGVLEHPFFAVTDEKGNFEIKNLPAGEYELEAWHEKYGTQTMKVTVDAAGTKSVEFTYEAK